MGSPGGRGMNYYVQEYIEAKRSKDPTAAEDKIFFYANQVMHDHLSGWEIRIAPTKGNGCLTSMESSPGDLPRVSELRLAKPQKLDKALGPIVYAGRILFSAGIILRFVDKVLMLRRDKNAPVDKLKWTSPAGRCDREPCLTALKEFYEEVIIFDRASGQPVFVRFPWIGYADECERTYAETLKSRSFPDPGTNEWQYIDAQFPSLEGHELLEPVRTNWNPRAANTLIAGAESFAESFFAFMDEESNTLELRLVADIVLGLEHVGQLAFCDGEDYGREVKLLDPEKLVDVDLVASMREYVKRTSQRTGC